MINDYGLDDGRGGMKGKEGGVQCKQTARGSERERERDKHFAWACRLRVRMRARTNCGLKQWYSRILKKE